MNATQRYLMLYLQDKGLLARTIRYYRELAPGPGSEWPLANWQSRERAFAKATGIDPDQGNASFQQWLAATINAQPKASVEVPTGTAGRSIDKKSVASAVALFASPFRVDRL